MPRLLKRPEAEADLGDIWLYTAQDIPSSADAFWDSVQEVCLALATRPNMGRRRDDLLSLLRSIPLGNYLIFYFPIEGGIDVVRVLQGKRDIPALF